MKQNHHIENLVERTGTSFCKVARSNYDVRLKMYQTDNMNKWSCVIYLRSISAFAVTERIEQKTTVMDRLHDMGNKPLNSAPLVRFTDLGLVNNMNFKSTIFWDITPYSPLSVNRRFGEKYRPHFQWRQNISWSRNQSESMWLTFNGLHGVISQKMVLFITTAVRTSNPTTWILAYIPYFIL
jgi:hypothetical protein